MKNFNSTNLTNAIYLKQKYENDLKWEFLQYIESLKALEESKITSLKVLIDIKAAVKSLPVPPSFDSKVVQRSPKS